MFASGWTGKQVGDFIIEQPIGRGGMAMVYSARQRSVDRQVALKIIELQPGGDAEFLKRFTHEAEVIAMLEHMHILPVYGYGVLEDEAAYFAMRLLRHGTLGDLLRKGALSLDDALDLFTQIASGLSYIHSRGVIHRDLKPNNILLDENGNAFLTDFGLALLVDVTVNFSDETPHLGGSPAYIAPELIKGQVADPLSDIYSLGVILYQMLCGRLPFESEDGGVSALLYKHMHEKPTSLRQLNPKIPPAVEAVALRALSKNPRERFSSADDMADALRVAVQRSSTSRTRAVLDGVGTVIPRLTPRHLAYLALFIAACALVVILAVRALRVPAAPTMNVEAGEQATLSEMSLSDDEIALARARLQPGGFIANFPCVMSDTFQAAVANGLSERASEAQLPMRLYDSLGDPAREMAMIEQARIEGAKAFILCPLGEPLLDDTIRSLQQAAIPLVLAQRYDSPYGIKVQLDDQAVGWEQGRYAGQVLQAEHGGQGTIVVLSFLDIAAGQTRAQGMIDGLHQMAPDAEIIGPLGGYTREQAAQTLQGLLASNTHFEGIVTISDAAALGAVDALEAANVSPQDVFIVSADDEEPISTYIREGRYVRASVALDPSENAQLLLTGIVKALAGSPVPEHLMLGSGTLDTAPSN